jgi:hypothetical protein
LGLGCHLILGDGGGEGRRRERGGGRDGTVRKTRKRYVVLFTESRGQKSMAIRSEQPHCSVGSVQVAVYCALGLRKYSG